ncbi:hypothetical protein BP6252_01668 [Coleophoma cylindrospora]|uniref:DOMON domain-containing protein n=1 Tax=Coleophoma cylindrospora TaxID=1849047 RepID=A0A3D8STL1_9HELO|nr:hypothetical protein BP6252_01668 [Coleophoma cylindrospora]
MRFSNLAALSGLASFAAAQNSSSSTPNSVTYCPGSGVCYSVNIPAKTASAGTGDIFIQMTGPSTMSWIGLGQGTAMSGSNILMIYANAAGTNVTLSPRLGTGERQPSASTSQQVTLLGGSGISKGVMTANIKCSNCNSWSGGSMSFTDTKSNWIYAYLSGAAISSDSVSANLGQHSQYGTTTLNLASAAGGSSSNPFLTSTATTSSNSGVGSSTNSADAVATYQKVLMAHAIMMPVAFVLMYPIGGMIIRLLHFGGVWKLHAGWMILTLGLTIAGFGTGVYLADTSKRISASHAVLGIIVVVALCAQPISGWLHHSIFVKYGQSPNKFTFPHMVWGRIWISIGIINGGLGLKLSDNSETGKVAYAVCAFIMWTAWTISSFIGLRKKRAAFMKPDVGEELVPVRHRGEKLRSPSPRMTDRAAGDQQSGRQHR